MGLFRAPLTPRGPPNEFLRGRFPVALSLPPSGVLPGASGGERRVGNLRTWPFPRSERRVGTNAG